MLHKKYVKNKLLVQLQNHSNSSFIRAFKHLRKGFMIRLGTRDV